MKRLISCALLSLTLTGCFGSDKNNQANPLTEGSYVVQMRAADYSSSAVATGNILGDRSVTQTILAKTQSDYDISTQGSWLYHLGRFDVDEITLYNSTISLTDEVWTRSANDDGENSANPYSVVHISDTQAYVIRYGSANVWEINPSAVDAESFVTNRIDLSAYNNGDAGTPAMNDAVYYNNKLYVVMQRLDENWSPSAAAYIAVIDTSDNSEIDTDPQTDGLQVIELTITNTQSSDLHNGILYVAGRGDFGSDSGGLDKVDLTTYQVTNIFNTETSAFSDLNNAGNDTYFHILDVAVVDEQTAYVHVNVETGWTTDFSVVYPFNPSTGSLAAALTIPVIDEKEISDISIDPNNRLWIGIADATAPVLVVVDTDTNTQSDIINLEMLPTSIHFLTVN